MHKVNPSTVFAQDPAPSTINPVVHETCGASTVLLCDVTDRFEFQFFFVAHWLLAMDPCM